MEPLAFIDLDDPDAPSFAAPFDVVLQTTKGVVNVEADPMGWEDAEYAYRAAHPKPKPPRSRELVKDPAILSQLGERKPVIVLQYDAQDADWLIRQEQWLDGRNLWVMAFCLKLELRRGGVPITETAERVKALRALGVTTLQAAHFRVGLNALSELAEAGAVGFSGNGSDPLDSVDSSDPPPETSG